MADSEETDKQTDGVELSPEQKRRRRSRSIAIAVVLAILVVLFYVITIFKMGGNVVERPL
ncbi:hypothetical protein [Amorphus orientalis]|uniref:Membrane protein affecting hemolysin expression n=1 Tax=Amorphus orientalis TaxID=649198 RepID=A0AAE3VQX9_9HYPH|nr:hypothetical protein [Amorphus orientalis]MDQ0316712.1 putative membrane protein affecting hemolysin expression [Amorphus orientalis]